jgi:hypothetical protein
MSTQTAPAPSPQASAWRPKSRRAHVHCAIVLAASLVVVAALLWTWRHPQAFPQASGRVDLVANDQHSGDPLYFGMTTELPASRGTVTISDIEPRVIEDTANARIRFYVCTISPRGGAGSIGSVYEPDLGQECAKVVPASGATLQLHAHPRQQVVMSVELRKPGSLRIHGMNMTYKYGWQTGTQNTGHTVLLRAN